MKPKLKYTVNYNFHFAPQIQALMEKHGVEVKPLKEGRSKSIGFMGDSGMYKVAGLIVDDFAHYQTVNDDRSWGIHSIDGCRSFTIAQDESGGYWVARSAFASLTDESVQWESFDIEAR